MKSVVKNIKVGIVLPIDELTEISINFSNPLKYKVNSGLLSKSLTAKCDSELLLFNGVHLSEIIIEPKTNIHTEEYATINSVPTGRGFHWQNTIDIQLHGKIIINNYHGNIFLVNELDIEDYLPYVAIAEMNAECPPALLKAQTIAARSWLLANRNANHPELSIDICNDDCCQRYQGITEVPQQSLQAIQKTHGQVLTYNDEICDARYSKNCGGITESFENVWGGEPIPYLSSISDSPKQFGELQTEQLKSFIKTSPNAFCSPKYIPEEEIKKYIGKVDKAGSYFRWEISYSQNEITSIVNSKLNLDAKSILKLIPLKLGHSGRIIQLKITYIDKSSNEKTIILKSEYEIRNALHKKFLYSSAIIIEQIPNTKPPEHFTIKGAGWGHGAGFCQIGALGMALDGYSAEEILLHYFCGSKIENIY